MDPSNGESRPKPAEEVQRRVTSINPSPSLRLDKRFSRIAIAFLLCALVLSAYVTYSVQSVSAYEIKYVPSAEYRHQSQYDYAVYLLSNTIYFNRTILQPGEFPYVDLVNTINFTFQYDFTGAPSVANSAKLTYAINFSLESSDGWKRVEEITPSTELVFTSSEISLSKAMSVNISQYLEIIRAIEKEIGEIGATYQLKITPQIRVEATVNGSKINDTFTPVLSMLLGSKNGNFIEFSGLSLKENGSVGRYEYTSNGWAFYAKNLSLVAPAYLLALTVYASTKLLRTVKEDEDVCAKIIKKYHSLIIESKDELPAKYGKTMIKVERLEDLVKISELNSQPIIHYKDDATHYFRVLLANDSSFEYALNAKKSADFI
ncbi:MAG: DUF5305 domain-containing protein [Candidatus Methanomethylicus sp.]|nr:DUF5305 domain-containing protein [Candidatus Methanomethylicus sp.]